MKRLIGSGTLACALVALILIAGASAQPVVHEKYGGTLTVGVVEGEPDALDPTLGRSASGAIIFNAICRGLYRVNGDDDLVPDLATALPAISKDKLTYTVPLRKGVLFNDGTPFDAQSVVTTYQRDLTLPGSFIATRLSYIDTVTASGSDTVVFHLSSRYAPLPTTLVQPIMSPAQLAKLGTSFASDPVCVGPFMFDHRVVGDNVTAIKSPYYYDKYAVHFDKIVWKFVSGPAAVAALEAGDLQVLDGGAAPNELGQTTGLHLISHPARQLDSIRINIGNRNGIGKLPYSNVGTPLASSAKLRQAFEEAIDRDAFVRVLGRGLGHPDCTPIPIANNAWYAGTKVPCTPYDPADARKLVASSGIASPTVHLMVDNSDTGQLAAQFIQAAEKAVGIEVVIDLVDFPTTLTRGAAGNFDAWLGGSSLSVDPGGFLRGIFGTDGPANYSGYSNPRLDLIFANGFKATSKQARTKLYRVAQQIILADRPVIVLDHVVTYAAYSTSVKLGNTTFLDYVFGQFT
jgi:peptide/nickel transport system substrate-binding protein